MSSGGPALPSWRVAIDVSLIRASSGQSFVDLEGLQGLLEKVMLADNRFRSLFSESFYLKNFGIKNCVTKML